MAWTSPRTWTTSEIVTASMMNTHVRDNLLETAPGKASAAGQTIHSTAANAVSMVTASKYKTADETVNNSTTFQDDDHLSFAIAANEVWAFEMFLYYTIASGNPGIKVKFTVPASCTGQGTVYIGAGVLDSSSTSLNNFFYSIGTGFNFALIGFTGVSFFGSGAIINSTNAGTVTLQWAQNSAVASDCKLKQGSYLNLKRLA